MRPLTKKQSDVLDFICSRIRSDGAPPTHDEIAAHIGASSTNSAHWHLVALSRKGYVALPAGKRSRGVRVLRDSSGVSFMDVRAEAEEYRRMSIRITAESFGTRASGLQVGDYVYLLAELLDGDRVVREVEVELFRGDTFTIKKGELCTATTDCSR